MMKGYVSDAPILMRVETSDSFDYTKLHIFYL